MSRNPAVIEADSASVLWNGVNSKVMEQDVSIAEAQVRSFAKPSSASVWYSMGREFKLDHQAQTSQVRAEIHKLLANQTKLYSIMKAAAPYIYFIYKQTQMRRLPAELALIPVIESEFNPNDYSKKGATGLWQLMPATAQDLGVRVKSGYDGRRNVIDSTKAALAYFNDLGKFFNGNWYLAIAAYNCGQMKIKSAVLSAGTENFWVLHVPKETQYYVPKLLAVAAIVKNPAKYGFRLPPVNDEPYFTQVNFKKKINKLEKISQSTGVSLKTLNSLNPDYKNGIIAKKGSYSLIIPIDKAPIIKAQLGVL